MNISPTSVAEIKNRLGLTSGLININGNKLHVEIAGEGIPIIFLHDGIADSRGFDSQFKAFGEFYTVIRYDREGYGLSKPPNVSYLEVADLKSLIDLMGLASVILIGGSAGGRLALDFSLTRPKLVVAQILVGPSISGYEFSEHMWYRGWRNEWGETLEDAINFWTNDPWLIAEENKYARARLRKFLETSGQNMENFPVEKLADVQALSRLSEIQVPTLTIVGEHDIADNHAQTGIIQNSIEDSIRKIVLHSGHLVYLEQPDEFNKLTREFLSGIFKSQ